ncbi:hypothetical protein H5410_056877 [Solanum commersonii]|uniref:ATP-dependent DNA helicase n=1 Tax=Solanum commersonii TaxID=4109 RepID=A0A9J5WNI4_SOLCO|nr:hypothetical protein H5410_056877 [Solanum commersonii]
MYVKVPVEDVDAQSKVNSGTPGLFFVDVPGVIRKTYLYQALLANVRSNGMIALASSISGVAATILPGGRTAHSQFGIPLQANETTMTNMSKQGGGDFNCTH